MDSTFTMDPPPKPPASLFEVYLRLRPSPFAATAERFLDVEDPILTSAISTPTSSIGRPLSRDRSGSSSLPRCITIRPPASDQRKRAVEKFAFTRVFEEPATQLDIFEGTGVKQMVEGVLGANGSSGRDGLLATLGMTGSGKTHTILGSRSQRGLTQMTLDTLFRSVGDLLVHPESDPYVYPSIAVSDVSEAQLIPASTFLNSIYGDGHTSRAQTPMSVGGPISLSSTPSKTRGQAAEGGRDSSISIQSTLDLPRKDPPTGTSGHKEAVTVPGSFPKSPSPAPVASHNSLASALFAPAPSSACSSPGRSVAAALSNIWTPNGKNTSRVDKSAYLYLKDGASFFTAPKRPIPRPECSPELPSMDHINLAVDDRSEYAIVVSMYEVYNDRIFDLLAGQAIQQGTPNIYNTGSYKASNTTGGSSKRRALLFKSTEHSPDRKVVAGLRKIICGSLDEALTVLETGLLERKVAGTGSNAASSRSHGFFCLEIKKRDRIQRRSWNTSTLTIVDLAGSERARNAKTAGSTLAEAGKINESLMYLGQCMQMQSDNSESNKNLIVPYRQCKLTELLFSNSFLSTASTANHQNHHHGSSHQSSGHHHSSHQRQPLRAIMIVTADPVGDFNATSQILRYSALAREVTVPRIPSVTSTILSGALTRPNSSNGGRTTPGAGMVSAEELEAATQTALRLAEELEVLSVRLVEETERRRLAEASWRAAEERMEEIEHEVRDECWGEMERRMEEERSRWAGAWVEESGRADERVDRKIEILGRMAGDEEQEAEGSGITATATVTTVKVLEDPPADMVEKVRELEEENDGLKRKIEAMEREKLGKTPSKKQRVLKSKKWEVDVGVETP